MATNEHIIKAPGMFKNLAVGGHLTTADQVLDDAIGKEQSQINAETATALDNRYTKDETYSKEQLNNLITTPEQQYVTVEDYASLPETGAADTVYRVANYDGIEVVSNKYAEYAWDGSAYQLLAVKEYGIDEKALIDSIDNVANFSNVSLSLRLTFTTGKGINSSGEIFNKTERIATEGFMDISYINRHNNTPLYDIENEEQIAYNIEPGYRLFVCYYNSAVENDFAGNEGWLTGSGVLTPQGDFMRVCYATVEDASTMTIEQADNIQINYKGSLMSIVEKINKLGLIYKGLASNTDFNENTEIGLYVVNSNHRNIPHNPLNSAGGALIVIPSGHYSESGIYLIPRLNQICVSFDTWKVYKRSVSGALTKTFSEWEEMLDYSQIYSNIDGVKESLESVFKNTTINFNSTFIKGRLQSDGKYNTDNQARITSDFKWLLNVAHLHYDIQDGYRLYGAFYVNESEDTFISNFGWLEGEGDVDVPVSANYFRVCYASLADEQELELSDADKIDITITPKPIVNQFASIVDKTNWLAVGDSITFGVYSYLNNGEPTSSVTSDSWVNLLANSLSYDIKVMASRGMGYSVTGQDPDDSSLPRITLDELLTRIEALTDNFNFITLAFGINDYASNTTINNMLAGLDDAIARLQTKWKNARLVVITPFNSCRAGDASTNYAYGYATYGKTLKQVADKIKERCELYGVECLYATNGFLFNNYNINELQPDKTHPSLNAHRLIAKTMANKLLY